MKRLAAMAVLAACATTGSTRGPHGIVRTEWPEGVPRTEGTYVDGAKHGLWQHYHEDGDLDFQALYSRGVAVWVSTDRHAKPPPALLASVEAALPDDLALLPVAAESEVPRMSAVADPAPQPYFASMDRTTALSRAGGGISLGGGNGLGFGSVQRSELFVNQRLGRYGVYGQYAQTSFEVMPEMDLSGRRTLELGATRTDDIRGVGALTLRAGLLAPIDNDNREGFLASSAAMPLRPTDAAAAFPSTIALRTGASVGRTHRRYVLQADGGIDWVMGGRADALDPLVRLNAAAGVGSRSTLLTLELSNTLRVLDPTQHLHAGTVAATLWVRGVWITGAVSVSHVGDAGLGTAVGYGW